MNKKGLSFWLIFLIFVFNIFILPASVNALKNPFSWQVSAILVGVTYLIILGVKNINKYFGPWIEKYYPKSKLSVFLDINFNPKKALLLNKKEYNGYLIFYSILNIFLYPFAVVAKILITSFYKIIWVKIYERYK
ncbi:hypothetical protein KKB10_03895 [Patescibacteria group bacterium]|nr:hypothetical protein [Patescibacteria group bacterium]MBU1951915.1 hypothetical protein [Patescibacteria group bacterium]